MIIVWYRCTVPPFSGPEIPSDPGRPMSETPPRLDLMSQRDLPGGCGWSAWWWPMCGLTYWKWWTFHHYSNFIEAKNWANIFGMMVNDLPISYISSGELRPPIGHETGEGFMIPCTPAAKKTAGVSAAALCSPCCAKDPKNMWLLFKGDHPRSSPQNGRNIYIYIYYLYIYIYIYLFIYLFTDFIYLYEYPKYVPLFRPFL